jgi:septum formation protein
MITRWLSFLNDKKIILASGSLQRRVLLQDLGLKFEVKTSDFEENLEKTNPDNYVSQTCFKKLEKFVEDNIELLVDIIITADTIIEKDGKIYEKPKNKEECIEWFSIYSNNSVNCSTSTCIAIIGKDSNNLNSILKYSQFITKTVVHFGNLTQDIILDYLESGEPFNKAGGFGIQGLGRTLIKKIEGCYFNVIGLPAFDFTYYLIKLLEEVYGKK